MFTNLLGPEPDTTPQSAEYSTLLPQVQNAFVDLNLVIKFLDQYMEDQVKTNLDTPNEIGTLKRVAYFYLFFLYMFKNDHQVHYMIKKQTLIIFVLIF